MTSIDVSPLGHPAFVSNTLDRAAHLRFSDEKLFALEGKSSSRAYVIYRDSLVMKKDGDAQRALLTIDEALKFGANPGTVFLGLRDGDAVFGMGIGAPAVEKLLDPRRCRRQRTPRHGHAGHGAAGTALGGCDRPKSLVSWHQRHGFCANCGAKSSMAEGGWKRVCPSCKTEHFPRTDPVVIMLVEKGDKCLLGRQKQFAPGMYSCLAGFVEAAETIEDAVKREIFEESGIRCTDVTYYMTQPWPYPSSLMIGCSARAISDEITVDKMELEDARWFDRDEAMLMRKREHPDGLAGPHPFAIAHHLLGRWLHPDQA